MRSFVELSCGWTDHVTLTFIQAQVHNCHYSLIINVGLSQMYVFILVVYVVCFMEGPYVVYHLYHLYTVHSTGVVMYYTIHPLSTPTTSIPLGMACPPQGKFGFPWLPFLHKTL